MLLWSDIASLVVQACVILSPISAILSSGNGTRHSGLLYQKDFAHGMNEILPQFTSFALLATGAFSLMVDSTIEPSAAQQVVDYIKLDYNPPSGPSILKASVTNTANTASSLQATTSRQHPWRPSQHPRPTPNHSRQPQRQDPYQPVNGSGPPPPPPPATKTTPWKGHRTPWIFIIALALFLSLSLVASLVYIFRRGKYRSQHPTAIIADSPPTIKADPLEPRASNSGIVTASRHPFAVPLSRTSIQVITTYTFAAYNSSQVAYEAYPTLASRLVLRIKDHPDKITSKYSLWAPIESSPVILLNDTRPYHHPVPELVGGVIMATLHGLLMHLWPVILAGGVFLIFDYFFSLEDEKAKGEDSGQKGYSYSIPPVVEIGGGCPDEPWEPRSSRDWATYALARLIPVDILAQVMDHWRRIKAAFFSPLTVVLMLLTIGLIFSVLLCLPSIILSELKSLPLTICYTLAYMFEQLGEAITFYEDYYQYSPLANPNWRANRRVFSQTLPLRMYLAPNQCERRSLSEFRSRDPPPSYSHWTMKLPEALQEIAEPEEELSETPLWPTTVSELPTAKYNAFVDSLVPDKDSRGLETSIHRRWWMDSERYPELEPYRERLVYLLKTLAESPSPPPFDPSKFAKACKPRRRNRQPLAIVTDVKIDTEPDVDEKTPTQTTYGAVSNEGEVEQLEENSTPDRPSEHQKNSSDPTEGPQYEGIGLQSPKATTLGEPAICPDLSNDLLSDSSKPERNSSIIHDNPQDQIEDTSLPSHNLTPTPIASDTHDELYSSSASRERGGTSSEAPHDEINTTLSPISTDAPTPNKDVACLEPPTEKLPRASRKRRLDPPGHDERSHDRDESQDTTLPLIVVAKPLTFSSSFPQSTTGPTGGSRKRGRHSADLEEASYLSEDSFSESSTAQVKAISSVESDFHSDGQGRPEAGRNSNSSIAHTTSTDPGIESHETEDDLDSDLLLKQELDMLLSEIDVPLKSPPPAEENLLRPPNKRARRSRA
ncbi:hypothetical protein CVT26_013497 [Gymnopilus dilepis]|uniref:CSC1/OSCA1-like 7TM region domain-containing protein n=1 Tax=Gymnopilus dilepis TaxID=231916 RepID=A0A409Y5J5_9AGAR|nr:hypothetical protein CVT26_013497 [Gymnopilus dilepis]